MTEVLPPGWSPSPGFDVAQSVDVIPGESSTAGDFANFSVLNGAIIGTIWDDRNRNGLRDTDLAGAFTEPGLSGWSVFLDLNGNGVQDAGEPVDTTDAAGAYTFADLQVGEYEVRELLPAGWETTVGYDDNYPVTVYSGATTVANDFANFNITSAVPGSVGGTVWNDLDGDGVRDTDTTGAFTDPGLAGWGLFLDLNGNGARDASEPEATTGSDGSYVFTNVRPGTVGVIETLATGWRATSPLTGTRIISLRNGENATGLDFGNVAPKNSAVHGVVFADTNKNGVRDPGERGLSDLVVYLDLNTNGTLDPGEPQATTASDQFFTPTVDEAGTYSFTHLNTGTYTVRVILPNTLSATPASERSHTVTLAMGDDPAVNTAAVFRANEIHGVDFRDLDGDHVRDPGEPAVVGATVYIDLNRNDALDPGEPSTVTGADGSYHFLDLAPGSYVVREVLGAGYDRTYPTTTGGVLWPTGTSNPAVGNVGPTSITTVLAAGQTHHETVSITLPGTGSLTNMVDVFLLFDDTGSFVNNSPIVRGAFPTIISQLLSTLPGIDLGFGVGRFEEYANFALEYATGRPFVLNQPIVASSTAGFMTSIQAALNRTTPGYGGDQPETDIEALYQLVTGRGFDGNNNGSTQDSGAAGLVSTQLSPGASGDVPSFASFRADATGSVLPAAGNVGGGGFRAGALPIILLATDTGFAYQPKGETSITGVGGLTLPIGAFTETSRNTTPFNYGAGIQETITALNALGALVIGLGTNGQTNLDPRQGLSAISKLTGAVNRSAGPILNGTTTPIAPGDPLYFQIASGFAGSVTDGVVNAIRNAATSVAMDVTLRSSDPRVVIVNQPGVRSGVGAGQTASFDVQFTGDGVPHRFDLQFVRAGTNVVLGSIPVVIGTPIPGDGYEFEDLEEGEIENESDFGSRESSVVITTPSITVTGGTVTYDALAHAATATATGQGGVSVPGTFAFTYNGSTTVPVNVGTYAVLATFTSSDPNYGDATGTGVLTISAATPRITVTSGTFAYDANPHAATASATGLGGVTVPGSFVFTYNGDPTPPKNVGTYSVVASFTSSDPNYGDATGTSTITIQAATPNVRVMGGLFVYDGAAHPATAVVTDALGGVVPGALSFVYRRAGVPVDPIDAGPYDVTATFISTDPNFGNAEGTGVLTIDRATPVFTNLASPQITVGTTSTTLSGHLAAGGVTPSGSPVSVTINGVTLDATVTSSGDFSVLFPTGTLTAGSYSVVYAFAGSPNFSSAADGLATLTVGTLSHSTTTTTLASSAPISVPNQFVVFTASVLPSDVASGPLTGQVEFRDGVTLLGMSPVVDGLATWMVRPIVLGQHPITARYVGDPGHDPSSASLVQTVRQVALEPGPIAGSYELNVGGALGRDKVQIQVERRSAGDRFVVQIEASGGPNGSYQYSTDVVASSRISRVVFYGVGTSESVSLDTVGLAIPARMFGGPGDNRFSGGDGPTVMVGGQGVNTFNSGNGRSLLISGKGRGKLTAGSGDAILLGGWTSYDLPTPSNLAALDQIMAEWDSSDSLATRVAHLTGTLAGGRNGGTLLNATTVHDNQLGDTLNAGTGDTWFLGNVIQDVLRKKKTGDLFTGLDGW